MTFDAQISTTAAQAFADVRDKVSSVSGWGVSDDSVSDGHIVFSTPEDVEVGISESMAGGGGDGPFHREDHDNEVDGIGVKEGMNWDPSNNSFELDGESGYGTVDYHQHNNDAELHHYSKDDECEYWLQYSTDGFYYYIRRVDGDGEDHAYGAGYQLWETEYWDFHSANTSSGYAAQGSAGGTGPAGFDKSNCREVSMSYGGDGILNPDANFANYIYDEEIFEFSPAENNDTGEHPKAATTPGLWKKDNSGTSLNAGDVVQGSGGTNEYMILDYHDARVAISMK